MGSPGFQKHLQKSGSEIDNRVRAFFDRSQDSPVEEVGTKRLGPLAAGARHLAMNFFPALAGEFSCKGIAEERVGTISFHGAMEGCPTCRVGNVANERLFRG